MKRRVLVSTAAFAFKALYRVSNKKRRRDEAVFLSRQTNTPSYDFAQIAQEFERRGWKVHMHLKKVSNRNLPSYAFHVLKELRLLGRCRVALLDRYDPVVSLLDFECDRAPEEHAANSASAGSAAPASNAPRNNTASSSSPTNWDFPRKPVILQVWHAFGAFKKFGFQSVDTPEGHSADFTSTFNIHRNYSWVFCSGEGARPSFAEAFSYPIERVVAMDRPEYDELAAKARERAERRAAREPGPLKVLMAPTLRINEDSAHPFRDLYEQRASFEKAVADACGATVQWSFHPLESKLPAPGNVSDQLLACDCVVTDYSSIVYEAYLLGIPALFYVPDIQSYRVSPGLNTDPSTTCPGLCAFTQDELVASIADLADAAAQTYPKEELEAFAASAFDIPMERTTSAAARIVDFAIAHAS